MRVCMPTVSDAGLDARLSPHFGSAPWFTVVDGETGEARALANGHARHEHGQCVPAHELDGQGIGVLICRGLGHRALMKLQAQGMEVLATEAWTVAAALAAYRSGALQPMRLEAACAGHHGQGHGPTRSHH